MLNLNGNNYMLCKVEAVEDSDNLSFESISWGYDTADEAFAELDRCAKNGEHDGRGLAVIRLIDRSGEEA